MENKTLLLIQKSLVKNTDCFSFFKDDNILALSEDKLSAPFCFLISENSGKILVSVAINYTNSTFIASLVVLMSKTVDLIIAEPFYYTGDERLVWGEEAEKRWFFDTEVNLEELEFDTTNLH